MTQGLKSALMATIDTSGANGTTGQEVRNVVESTFIVDTRTATATGAVTSDDDYVRIDSTSGAVTLTLPTLALALQQQYTFKWVAGGNAATLDGAGAEQIEGSNTYVFATLLDAVILRPGATQWEIVSEFLNA